MLCAPVSADDLAVCEIRTLDTMAELIESYRLRFQIYSTLGYLQRANQSNLEIDEYDTAAIPLGAFEPQSGSMVGLLRLITTTPLPKYDRLVRRVCAVYDDPALTRQAFGPPPHQLPSIVSDEIDRQIEVFNTDKFTVQELSRFIVRPDHRGSGVSRALMEFGLVQAARTAHTVLIGGCTSEHLPLYAKFGYRKLLESGLDHFDSVGQTAHACVCRTDVLPEPTQSHIDALRSAMESGDQECTLEIGRNVRARFRFTGPRGLRDGPLYGGRHDDEHRQPDRSVRDREQVPRRSPAPASSPAPAVRAEIRRYRPDRAQGDLSAIAQA
jgi:predicted GNAT family N-acyltransferase